MNKEIGQITNYITQLAFYKPSVEFTYSNSYNKPFHAASINGYLIEVYQDAVYVFNSNENKTVHYNGDFTELYNQLLNLHKQKKTELKETMDKLYTLIDDVGEHGV